MDFPRRLQFDDKEFQGQESVVFRLPVETRCFRTWRSNLRESGSWLRCCTASGILQVARQSSRLVVVMSCWNVETTTNGDGMRGEQERVRERDWRKMMTVTEEGSKLGVERRTSRTVLQIVRYWRKRKQGKDVLKVSKADAFTSHRVIEFNELLFAEQCRSNRSDFQSR